MKVKGSLTSFAWLVLTAGIALAQEAPSSASDITGRPDNCEGSMARLDSVRNKALESAGKDGVIIIIAQLGTGEVIRSRNRDRLLAARQYLAQYGWPVQRMVLAEGERATGFGRVELYVAGKLQDVLLLSRNRGLCVECCNPGPEDYTSYRKRQKRR